MMSLRCVDSPKARMPSAIICRISKEQYHYNHEYRENMRTLFAIREVVLQILHCRFISV